MCVIYKKDYGLNSLSFYLFSLLSAKSEPKPVSKPRITVWTGPPSTETSKTDTAASDASPAAIAAPDAFLKLNGSEEFDAPLITFSPAPASDAATSRIGMSTMSNTTFQRVINVVNHLFISESQSRTFHGACWKRVKSSCKQHKRIFSIGNYSLL